jgi:hypothetical protein
MIDHSLPILTDRPECPGRLQRRRKTAKRLPHGRRQFDPCLPCLAETSRNHPPRLPAAVSVHSDRMEGNPARHHPQSTLRLTVREVRNVATFT